MLTHTNGAIPPTSRTPDHSCDLPEDGDPFPAYRPNRAAHRKRAAASLRRNRARGLLPHGRVGRAGARCDLVRQRGFNHPRTPGALLHEGSSAGCRPEPHCLSFVDARQGPEDGFDNSMSCTSTSISCISPSSILLSVPTVTTLHGRQDLPDLKALYAHFHDMPLVAISESQHRAIPKAHVAATVYHGAARQSAPTHTICPRRLSGVSRSHLTGKRG